MASWESQRGTIHIFHCKPTEPTFAAYLLTFRNHYYLIGEGHKEFLADKTADEGLSAGLRRRRADQVS